MIEDNPLMKWLWPLLASLAGAVTALSFRPYKKMAPIDIFMALFVGTTFSWFVSPVVAHATLGYTPDSIRGMGAIFYVMATGSNVLIPFAVQRLKKIFGADLPENES